MTDTELASLVRENIQELLAGLTLLRDLHEEHEWMWVELDQLRERLQGESATE